MPEAIVAVPTLQIPSDITSEMESSSTTTGVSDRSTDSHIAGAQVKPNVGKVVSKSQGKNPIRKSYGRRIKKKTPLTPTTSQKEVTKALKLKSHLPRAVLLTPSTSSTSLATNEYLPKPLVSLEKAVVTPEYLLDSTESNRSCLVFQNSSLTWAFRHRKSYSQMDFSQARRVLYPPCPNLKNNDNRDNSKALMASNCGENMLAVYAKNSFVHKMYNQDCYIPMSRRDSQMAGLRIFATIMLNAWRKRRDDVRRLAEEVADLKRAGTKAKNQLHVVNTLFRVEQKRNDELNWRLKRSLEDINFTKSSCDNLTTSLITIKADKVLVEQQLSMKEQEFESINTLLSQTKSDLFQCMAVQRELQASLSMEQRQFQILENQKNDLINEICELNNEAMQKEVDLLKELESKSLEVVKMKEKLDAVEEEMRKINQSSEQQLSESKAREERMEQEKAALEKELKLMQKCLEATFGNRIKNCWNNTMAYHEVTLEVLHWLAFYTLPAMPPPKIKTLPFSLSLNKALSIIKR